MRLAVIAILGVAFIVSCSGRKRQAIATTCATNEVEQDGACVKKIPEGPGDLNTGASTFEPTIPTEPTSPQGPQGTTGFDPSSEGTEQEPDPASPTVDWDSITGTTPQTQTPATATPPASTATQTQTPTPTPTPTPTQTPTPPSWQQTQQQLPAAAPSSLQMAESPAAASAGAPDVSLALYATNGRFQAYAAFSHTEQLADVSVTYHDEPIGFKKQLLSDGKLAIADLEMLVSMSFQFGTQTCKVERIKIRPIAKTHRPKCG